jgi:hypothetical protein
VVGDVVGRVDEGAILLGLLEDIPVWRVVAEVEQGLIVFD